MSTITELAPGWQIAIDLSPDWAFFRLQGDAFAADSHPPLAEFMWHTAEQHHLKRLVFEIDDRLLLNSFLIGQIVLLHKRLTLHNGVLRLCGLSAGNYRVIELMNLAERFPNYATRADAVMGHRPERH